jgi:hypothetical protein
MESKPNYKKAYMILMEFFDFIPESVKADVDEELKRCGL